MATVSDVPSDSNDRRKALAEKEFHTREEFAEYVEVSVKTVDRMRERGMPSMSTGSPKRPSIRILRKKALKWMEGNSGDDDGGLGDQINKNIY